MAAYVDYSFYKSLYAEKSIPEVDFNRLSWDACRKIDIATTGVDGVRKLQVAFPTDEYAAESVKRCVCSIIEIMRQIEEAKDTSQMSKGYVETENGLQGKVITSKSAGNESISYSANGSTATLIDKALCDSSVREKLYQDTISEMLSGITDANGVNLLYMGRYPT